MSYQSASESNSEHSVQWDELSITDILSDIPESQSIDDVDYTVPEGVGVNNNFNNQYEVANGNSQFGYQLDSLFPNLESSNLLSPTWEKQNQNIRPSPLNMSTYFSSFNPNTQVQPQQVQYRVIHNNIILNKNLAHFKYINNMSKCHRARIRLVPTATGTYKAIVKRKRKRTVFTTEQIEALERVFSKKPYVTREERQILVNQLQLNDKSVKVWFQNRRLKGKRDDNDIENREDMCSLIDRIDYVEAKIKESTNQYGYVTLDDSTMSELVDVIDDYLRTPVNAPATDISVVEPNPMYEPISPASSIEESTNEEFTNEESRSPYDDDSLQTLSDIDSLIST